MAVRDDLLALLEDHKGRFYSGESIAKELGCSRGAVWKAVSILKKEGYHIDAVTNRGYRMGTDNDVLTLAGITKRLKTAGLRPEVRRKVSSTNTILREWAAEGAPEGTVIIAGRQTAGRGRLGRSFFSPSDTGLYLSLLLRPEMDAADALRLTTAAAAAVALAIEHTVGVKADIKWVNDIYVGGKKVCGILTEAAFSAETGGLDYAVLGIGVNVYEPEEGFPEEIREVAGAVSQEKVEELRSTMAAEILDNFMEFYRTLPERTYLVPYRERLLWKDKTVWVIRGQERYPARLLGVDDDCALMVRRADGTRARLSSGEISIRLNDSEDI